MSVYDYPVSSNILGPFALRLIPGAHFDPETDGFVNGKGRLQRLPGSQFTTLGESQFKWYRKNGMPEESGNLLLRLVMEDLWLLDWVTGWLLIRRSKTNGGRLVKESNVTHDLVRKLLDVGCIHCIHLQDCGIYTVTQVGRDYAKLLLEARQKQS